MKRALALGVFVLICAGPAAATIDYRISLKNPQKHEFRVRMTIPNPAPDTQVAIPAWNALYQVRDFSYRVRNVSSSYSAGGSGDTSGGTLVLPLDKIDK